MIRVDIPEKNTFAEFPDGTPEDEIVRTIKRDIFGIPQSALNVDTIPSHGTEQHSTEKSSGLQLADIRKKYPQYDDLSDEQLAKGLHTKHYSDLDFDDFSKRIGYSPALTDQDVSDQPRAFNESASDFISTLMPSQRPKSVEIPDTMYRHHADLTDMPDMLRPSHNPIIEPESPPPMQISTITGQPIEPAPMPTIPNVRGGQFTEGLKDVARSGMSGLGAFYNSGLPELIAPGYTGHPESNHGR